MMITLWPAPYWRLNQINRPWALPGSQPSRAIRRLGRWVLLRHLFQENAHPGPIWRSSTSSRVYKAVEPSKEVEPGSWVGRREAEVEIESSRRRFLNEQKVEVGTG